MRTALILLFFAFMPLRAMGAEGIPLYHELRGSVVTVEGITPARAPGRRGAGLFSTSGAGVILDAEGTIATNTHVIFGARHIRVTLRDGEKLNASVLYVSPGEDLSLLKVAPSRPLMPVAWADSNLARLNDEVITLGHSELLRSTISGGRIKAIGVRRDDPQRTPEFFELDINHYKGDSGGPVFNRKGEFLGLMSAKRANADRACLAVPSNKVHFAYLSVANPSQKR